jgi:hypothetical protein
LSKTREILTKWIVDIQNDRVHDGPLPLKQEQKDLLIRTLQCICADIDAAEDTHNQPAPAPATSAEPQRTLVIERLPDWNYGAYLGMTDSSCIAIGRDAEEADKNGWRRIEAALRQPGTPAEEKKCD